MKNIGTLLVFKPVCRDFSEINHYLLISLLAKAGYKSNTVF